VQRFAVLLLEEKEKEEFLTPTPQENGRKQLILLSVMRLLPVSIKSHSFG